RAYPYHGVLAPHSGWRARVVAYGAPPAEVPVVASAAPEADDEPTTAPVVRYWAWADLMRRVFDVDMLACPVLRRTPAAHCHGRRSRRDSRDPARGHRVARAGGAGTAVRADGEEHLRGGARGLSPAQRRVRRILFARAAGSAGSRSARRCAAENP